MAQQSLSIQMIGTGSAFTTQFYHTSLLVRIHESTEDQFRLLVECGPTALRALSEQGLSLKDINGIFITHLHNDRIGGLEEVANKCRYELKKKMKLYVPADLVNPLWYQCLRAGLEVSSEGVNTLRDWFDIYPVEQFFNLEGIWFRIRPTLHVPGMPNFSLYIHDKVFYSGDIVFDRHLLEEIATQCDIILHDVQLAPNPVSHAGINQLLTLPTDTQQKMKLLHYEDNMHEYKGKIGRLTFVEQGQAFAVTV